MHHGNSMMPKAGSPSCNIRTQFVSNCVRILLKAIMTQERVKLMIPNRCWAAILGSTKTLTNLFNIALTLKGLGHLLQNEVLITNVVQHRCNIFIWNWSNKINIKSALRILMAWCVSSRASVATVLTTHPCVSQCLRANGFGNEPKTYIL